MKNGARSTQRTKFLNLTQSDCQLSVVFVCWMAASTVSCGLPYLGYRYSPFGESRCPKLGKWLYHAFWALSYTEMSKTNPLDYGFHQCTATACAASSGCSCHTFGLLLPHLWFAPATPLVCSCHTFGFFSATPLVCFLPHLWFASCRTFGLLLLHLWCLWFLFCHTFGLLPATSLACS